MKLPKERRTRRALHCCFAIGAFTAAMESHSAWADDTDTSGTPKQLQAVTVTGSAIPRTSTETSSPVQVITRADIDRSGLTTTADVVRSVSADNSGSVPTAFGNGFAAGSSGVALRGLTVNSTLVLIDGRRAANYALDDDGERGFVDLNTIPLNAVDRIEILKDGASALYGADAIAGVVNIIMKKEYRAKEFVFEGGTSQHGGGTTTHLSGIVGTGSLPANRYNAYLSFEYQKDDRIAASQRGFPFNTQDLSPLGGVNLIGGQPSSDSGSIYGSVTPATLVGGTATAVDGALVQPLNACGKGTTQVTDSSGSYCTQNFQGQYLDEQPAEQRYGLNGRFTFQVDDSTQAYLNASFYENKVLVDGVPAQIQNGIPTNTNGIALPPTLPDGSLNPNDPFAAAGQYALINYAFGDIPASSHYSNQNYRFVAGIKGSAFNWDYDSAVVINHTSLLSQLNGYINYPQLITDVTNGTYNFNQSLGPNSPATLAALAPTLTKTSTTDLDSIDFRASRELFMLPGGAVGLALGGEYRYEAQRDPDLNPGNLAQGLGATFATGQQDVAATYAEVNLPLMTMLEVDAAARYDHYSNFADHGVTPKIGIKFTPIEQVALRGTFSKGFRAPSFAESSSGGVTGFISSTPPQDFMAAHGKDLYSQTYTLATVTSANPKLSPEKSRNYTLGAVFQPIKPLSVAIDYYNIRKTNLIVGSDAGSAVDAYYNGQPLPAGYTLTLDNPDPAFPGAAPRPISIGSPYQNATAEQTSGFDVDFALNLKPTAQTKIISELTLTEIASFKLINTDGTTQQYVGTEAPYILSSGAGTPRYRATWANTLIVGPATITGTTYFVSGFKQTGVDATGDASACLDVDAAQADFPAGCHVKSFIDFDLTGSYKLTSYLEVFGAIENLFDTNPPFNPANYAGINYNPTYGQAGIVGRFFRGGVKLHF